MDDPKLENPVDAGAPTPDLENGMLLPFEKEHLHGEYKNLFVRKRHNFFASIQQFCSLWSCFLLLDEIWFRGIRDFERPANSIQLFALLFFKTAHSQYQTAFELGFSTKFTEAWNIFRSAIELVTFGLKVMREPHLAQVWIDQERGDAEKKAFDKAFKDQKKKSMFPSSQGLEKLHHYYSQYSGMGTHASVSAMSWRFRVKDVPHGQQWILDYLETDSKKIGLALFSMLDASHEMEKAFFCCFRDRLQFDHRLVNMRAEFERQKRLCRDEIISRFDLKPPLIWS